MTYTERKATIGENLLSQLRSLSHLSLSIIQAAPFTQNTVCFLSYTSCHCLKQWDSSLSSNACCDVYVVLVFTQWNTGKLQNTEYSHYTHLRNVIVGNVYSDAGTWWQIDWKQPWSLPLFFLTVVSPPGVLKWGFLVRFDRQSSNLHSWLTILIWRALKLNILRYNWFLHSSFKDISHTMTNIIYLYKE